MTDPILHLPLTAEDNEIRDARGNDIADVWPIKSEDDSASYDARHDRANARADEIVRRVNLHDELVVMLRYLDRRGGLGLDVHEQIRAVLAKVEGR